MESKKEIAKSLADYYGGLFDEYGSTTLGVGWGAEEKRAKSRYLEMMRILKEFKDKRSKLNLIDVGCGYGAFLSTIKEEKLDKFITYKGIDLVKQMIQAGNEAHPDGSFVNGNFLDIDCQEYDIGICNGILTQKRDAGEKEMAEYLYQLINKLFVQAKIGCSFNVMSEFVDYKSNFLYYPSMDKLVRYIMKNLTRKIVTSYHYGELHEVTLHLYR